MTCQRYAPRIGSAWPDAPNKEATTGTNKRYAARLDKAYDKRTDEIVMRDGTPATLTNAELELERLPLTRTPVPIEAIAWVHYGAIAVRVQVEIVAWTSRACAVRWTTPAGRVDKAWVWASAVERG